MTLYTKRIGDTGPVLLFIVGGNGDSTVFEGVAAQLADRYRVVLYDRAGFARSPVDTVPADKLAADVEDARALLADEPGYVFGSSSGAIVTLELLARHPSVVLTAVPHEPPLISLLPDRDERLAEMDEIYQLYRSDGYEAAMALFTKAVGLAPQAPRAEFEPPPGMREVFDRMRHNVPFWFDHEFNPYPRHRPDLAALAAVKEEPRGLVITLSGSVLFATDKSELLPSASSRLDEVAEALKHLESRTHVGKVVLESA